MAAPLAIVMWAAEVVQIKAATVTAPVGRLRSPASRGNESGLTMLKHPLTVNLPLFATMGTPNDHPSK